MRWPNENKYDSQVQAAASAYNVPVPLIKAIISLESEFLANAYRDEAPRSSLPPTPDFPAGGDRSIGLMQLLVRTARTLGYAGPVGDRTTLTGLYDPSTNIALGTELLRDDVAEARRRGLGLDAAVSAYNGGWRPSLGYGGKLASGKYANQAYVNVVNERFGYFGGGSLAGGSSSSSSASDVPTSDANVQAPDITTLLNAASDTPSAPLPSGIEFLDAPPGTTPGDSGGTGTALAVLGLALALALLATELLGGKRGQ